MARRYVLFCLIGMMAGLTFTALAQERANSTALPNAMAPAHGAAAPAASHSSTVASADPNAAEKRALRLEGEKRFRTNCGRCHQPPHKFPPRIMATAIRHMRVRAMITDEDMRLILGYMTQ